MTYVQIIVIVILAILLFFSCRKIKTVEEIVLLALLGAISSALRGIFAFLPNIQPSSFIIIMSGFFFGRHFGFLVGIITAFLSNMILGQGPWTMWQILAWGLMGYTSGILGKKFMKTFDDNTDTQLKKINGNIKYILAVFGLIWGFLFGIIMNLWVVLKYVKPLTLKGAMTTFIAGVPFDLAHAIGNAIFIIILFKPFLKVFYRISIRYGISNQKKE